MIIHANKDYTKEISKLMLKELDKPNPKFPIKMIEQFREHAKEKNILKEFENLNLIAFLAIDNQLTGFIIGYQENSNSAMIHYVAGNDFETKKVLLKEFINECKKRKINNIITDTFKFMENNILFKENRFVLTKKEKITKNLERLWYKYIIPKQ